MNKQLHLALEDCLKAMQDGADLDSALARHPDLADELRPMLRDAGAAAGLDPDPVPANVVREGRQRLLARVDAARRKRKNLRAIPRLWRFALAAAVVLAFLVLGSNGLVTASANSLPGDPLYGIKRMVEGIQLQLAASPGERVKLEDQFYQRRIDETASLLADKRLVPVQFSGWVEARLADGWVASGIHVVVDGQTVVNGDIVPGVQVEVTGMTQSNGTVLASRIGLEPEGIEDGGGPNALGPGEGLATGTPTTQSGDTPHPEGGSPGSGGGSDGGNGSGSGGGNGSGNGNGQTSLTPGSTSGSSQGSGDVTKTPEPTRTPQPTRTNEPTKTQEPSKTDEPTRTPEPTQ